MGKQYDAFVEESNKKLSVILSSPEYAEKEKQMIVNSISAILQKHINDPGNMPDIDYVINQSSLLYLDEELTQIINNPKADEKELERGLKLSERLKNFHSLFSEKKWNLPPVQQKDPQECYGRLLERKYSLSVISNIISLDKTLTSLISEAIMSLSKKKCDEASACLRQLQDQVNIAEKKDIKFGLITNSNFKKCAVSIEKIKNDAIRKEEADSQMLDLDKKICDAEVQGDTDEKYWSEGIKISKKQDQLISEYRTNRWPLPALKRTNMVEVREQFQTYQEMKRIDQLIRNKANSVNTEEQFSEFKNLCTKQCADLLKCEKYKWRIPGKIITNLGELESDIHSRVKEKTQRRKKQAARRKLFLAVVSVVVLTGLIFTGIHFLNLKGKVLPAFSSAEVVGKKYEEVVDAFNEAGFERVNIMEDEGGWLPDGVVTKVSIGNTLLFSKDQYYGAKENVTVYFSSQGRLEISDILKNWQNTSNIDLSHKLTKAGFKKVTMIEKATSDKTLANKIKQIKINDDNYESGLCYIAINSPIVIEYYQYKIIIGKDSKGFSGKEYTQVIDDLLAKGYKDIKSEAFTGGWQKAYTVVDVSINDSTEYKASDMFSDDAKIVVHFSSNDRIDISATIKEWKKIRYNELKQVLNQAGLSNVELTVSRTYDMDKHNFPAAITINGVPYESGDCYVRETDSIIIDFYQTVKKIGRNKNWMERRNYLEVKQYLTDQGFTNIVLKRTDDLWFAKEWGLFGGQGNENVREVQIYGLNDFTSDDEIFIDQQIVLLVNTYNGGSYEGM